MSSQITKPLKENPLRIHRTRNDNLLKENGKSDIVQSTFINDGIRLWNKAPVELKSCASLYTANKIIYQVYLIRWPKWWQCVLEWQKIPYLKYFKLYCYFAKSMKNVGLCLCIILLFWLFSYSGVQYLDKCCMSLFHLKLRLIKKQRNFLQIRFGMLTTFPRMISWEQSLWTWTGFHAVPRLKSNAQLTCSKWTELCQWSACSNRKEPRDGGPSTSKLTMRVCCFK